MGKKDEGAGGAPAWLLTYGDMITLILCFFVLLFTMSEIKKDKVSKTMRAFQKQFGVLPRYKATVQVFVEARRMTQTEANVKRRGPLGKYLNVTMIDQGKAMKIVIGGKTLFQAESDVLTEEGRDMIRRDVAPDLKGYENRIEIRGHTASSDYMDVWDLSYRRAVAVMRLLTATGIDRRRCRVVACADTEPISTNLTPEGRAENRRVEIVMTEEYVSDKSGVRQPKADEGIR
ncbi:MAG: OmpA/MotB family protein [Planctomycetota bacterium]|jgi:chemotaxis protein MotB